MGNVLKKYDVISETWQTVGGAVTGDTLPIGSMLPYGNVNPPAGWLVCDGSAVSRTTYADLFSVIGINYGEGDGTTTFNLPNKKGRVSAGYDSTNSKFNAIGKHLGEETHTLTLAELPQNIYLPYGQAGSTGKAAIGNNVVYLNSSYDGQAMFTCGGNSQPHNNIQPTEVDNWIIKAFQSSGVVANVAKTKTNSDNDVYSCNYINEKLTSEPKITVWTSSTPMITANNEEIRCIGNDGTVSSLLLSFLDTLTFTDSTKFSSSLVFKASSSGCSFALTPPTNVNFKMVGDDVTDGNFSPQPNKVYDIIFYWNGFYLNGIVKGTGEKTYEITIKNSGNPSYSSNRSFNIYTKEDMSDLTTIECSNSKKLILTQNYLYIEWASGLMDNYEKRLNCESESATNRTDSSGNTYWRYKVTITESPAYVEFRCWQDGPIK